MGLFDNIDSMAKARKSVAAEAAEYQKQRSKKKRHEAEQVADSMFQSEVEPPSGPKDWKTEVFGEPTKGGEV